MQLETLELSNFRNIVSADLSLHPRLNVFAGHNAQGKTNLLEAISLLGSLRSFRAKRLHELVRFDQPQAEVRGVTLSEGVTHRIGVVIREGRRAARLDGKTVMSPGHLSRALSVVLFVPADLAVFRGAPSERRRLVDRAVFLRYPTYYDEAQRYGRALKQKNRLLSEQSTAAVRAAFELEFQRLALIVTSRRLNLLGEITFYFSRIFSELMGGSRDLTVRYVISGESKRAENSALEDRLLFRGGDLAAGDHCSGELLSAIEHHLSTSIARSASREQHLGRAVIGPHMDDVQIEFDGVDARAFASQGQMRALVLAWKMAEIQLATATLGQTPLLLLDDVSSELDAIRNEQLFSFLDRSPAQCVLSTTDSVYVRSSKNRKDFQVVAGEFRS